MKKLVDLAWVFFWISTVTLGGGMAMLPLMDREFVTGVWPPEFERILNGESASMLAQDAQLGKL